MNNSIVEIKKENEEVFWIFGYGSLIWSPSFQYEKKIVGYIKGWKRRFYQGSPDHRGIPEKLGRVVTLIPPKKKDSITKNNNKYICWGIAYSVSLKLKDDVLNYLNYRERGGYIQEFVPVYNKESDKPIIEKALIYLANANNPNYLGKAPIEEIAKQIAFSVGKSGSNCEYLFKLAEFLRNLNIIDNHVFTIEYYVKKILLFN